MRATSPSGPSRMARMFAVALVVCLLPAGADAGATDTRPALVVDTTFTIVTADPQRSFDATASLVERAVYDTLLTYGTGSSNTPVPLLADSYTSADHARTWTFRLRHDVRFADGTPLTSADVVFSFRRLINLDGRPSFLLRGDTVSARGPYTVVIRSVTPVVAMPQIVASTSLGVLNSKLARLNGATDGKDASTTDTAENWLNSGASAGVGSGPYVLASYDPTTQITLAPNEHYWGARDPAWGAVVVRNLIAASQLLDVQRGTHEIAIDLSLAQARTIGDDTRLRVTVSPSPWVFLLFTNESRQGLEGHVESSLPGGGSLRPRLRIAGRGRGPGHDPGTRSDPELDPRLVTTARSRPHERGKGGGRARRRPVWAVRASHSNIRALSPRTAFRSRRSPRRCRRTSRRSGSTSVSTASPRRSGSRTTSATRWPSDSPHGRSTTRIRSTFWRSCRASSSVAMSAGMRAPTRQSRALAARARRTLGTDARAEIFRRIQLELNRHGPFFPLIQPTQVFVTTRDITGARFNLVYQLDITRTAPR